jgi:hypothetical protein
MKKIIAFIGLSFAFIACSGADHQDVFDPVSQPVVYPATDSSIVEMDSSVVHVTDSSVVDSSVADSSVIDSSVADAAPPPCVPKVCPANSCNLMNDGCNPIPIQCGSCAAGTGCVANACTINVIDHGGRVMPSVHLYAIYWGAGFSATTQSLYTSFLTGIGGTPYAAINEQYLRGDASAIIYKASFVDTVNVIPASVIDADIRAEIDRTIAANSLPYDANGIYFVFTPKTTKVCAGASCSCTDFCGYHLAYKDPLGRPVVYSSVPSAAACPGSCGIFALDADAPNGNVEADEGVSVIAHELMEAQSDAYQDGWYDSSVPSPKENADKCAYKYGVAPGIKTNQTWGGKSWLVQQNWSNAITACTSN